MITKMIGMNNSMTLFIGKDGMDNSFENLIYPFARALGVEGAANICTSRDRL